MNLLGAFFRHASHYSAALPYNLNWSRNLAALHPFLSKHPIVVCDVGASRGSKPELDPLKPYLRYYGFDGDQAECDRINNAPPRDFVSYTCLPRFIGDGGDAVFRLYRQRGLSSILALSSEYQRAFIGSAQVDQQVEVHTTTLDQALDSCPEPPDLLKLDTQGSEMEILAHAPRTVATCFLIEVEVEFLPIYEGQATFDAIHRFMLDEGFELLYLNRVFGQRKQIYAGPARGQMVFGDALYGRPPGRVMASVERLGKYVILLANYGHLDWAYEIYSSTRGLRELCPELERWFEGPSGLLKTALVAQLDKLLCLGLHLRKFNHLRWDSDRSWPIR